MTLSTVADGASVLFFLEVVLVGPEGELIVAFCVVVPPRRAELTNRGVELFIRPRIDGLMHSVSLVIHTSQEEVMLLTIPNEEYWDQKLALHYQYYYSAGEEHPRVDSFERVNSQSKYKERIW